MHVISLDHFLNDKGAVAIERGPARKVADFATAAVSYASNPRRPSGSPRPVCFKCRKPKDSDVEIGLSATDLVIWRCHACGCQGQISNWQGTFWDLSCSTPTR